MKMDAKTIKARMDKLYNSDWVNFNLFVPELLMVSGMNYSETDEGKWLLFCCDGSIFTGTDAASNRWNYL